MHPLLAHKPSSIFDVVDNRLFLEVGTAHDQYLKCGNYYEVYYAIAKHYQPKSILEIGVRYGYSLGVMASACDPLQAIGFDNDSYDAGSLRKARLSLTSLFPNTKFDLRLLDSKSLTSLPFADLIHIDGDHAFEGKMHDLRLSVGRCRTLIVDDYLYLTEVRSAVDRFIHNIEHRILNHFLIDSIRGTFVIEYKCPIF